ncbi:MAG: hypothetical protein JXR70_13840 [Spirochaetales bacterium]|nr:hypothetical protein [Spirochaetales bacterium]
MLKKFFLLLIGLLLMSLISCNLAITGSEDQGQDVQTQEQAAEQQSKAGVDSYNLTCFSTSVTQSFTIKNTGYHTYEYGGSAAPNIAHRFTIKINSTVVASDSPRTGKFYASKGNTMTISMVPLYYCYPSGSCYSWVLGNINVKSQAQSTPPVVNGNYNLTCFSSPAAKTFTILNTGYHTYEYGGSAAPNIAHRFTIKINGSVAVSNYPRTGRFYARQGDTMAISMEPFRYCYPSGACYDWVLGNMNVKY